jgi:hypothetical protein
MVTAKGYGLISAIGLDLDDSDYIA